MVSFTCRWAEAWSRLKDWFSREYFLFRLTFWSLFYNSLTSWSTVTDTLLEPLFWIVDHFVRYLGPAFVLLVVVLISSVIIIFYTCLLPEYYNDNWLRTAWHVTFGHWLLVNTVFHYFKAAFTSPGYPPEDTVRLYGPPSQAVPEVASICKKCISPKPPRAHHCSVCDRCILKMDHHCPWLNNCVGYHNHRHFFLFCFFLWIGTMYVSFCAYDPFKEHLFGTADIGITGFITHWQKIKEKLMIQRVAEASGGGHMNMTAAGEEARDMLAGYLDDQVPTRPTLGLHFHHFITYEFLLCSAVCVAIGLLTAWHARLIQRGETSIEVHINKREAARYKKKGMRYKNPYSYGPLQNWKNFLGLTHGRTLWRHVLLPSSHPASGDGMTWPLSTNNDTDVLSL